MQTLFAPYFQIHFQGYEYAPQEDKSKFEWSEEEKKAFETIKEESEESSKNSSLEHDEPRASKFVNPFKMKGFMQRRKSSLIDVHLTNAIDIEKFMGIKRNVDDLILEGFKPKVKQVKQKVKAHQLAMKKKYNKKEIR